MRFDYIADLLPERTNWCINAKVLYSWRVREFLTKRVLLLVDEKGDTIEAPYLPDTLANLPKYIDDGEWYSIRNFKVISPAMEERNTHHPYQIKFTGKTTMTLLESLSPKNYFRFEDLDDINRGRIDLPISFDVCACIMDVEDRRRPASIVDINEVVLMLLNGRCETVKCRLKDNFASQFMTIWQSSGCHLIYKSKPVFCVMRFMRVGEYEGAPCLENTLASSKIFIKPEFEGLEHHQAMTEFAGRYYINHVIKQQGESSGTQV